MRILMIEDDKKLCASVKFQLEKQGYSVDVCHDGEEGLFLMKERAHDCVLLDRMLPSMDGMSVLRESRISGVHTPVILLTALGDLQDRVAGLDMGADDYIVKPFAFEELTARIRSSLRRPLVWSNEHILSYGDLTYDSAQKTLTKQDVSCSLSRREGDLMELFLRNPAQTLPRLLILTRVWGPDAEIEDGNLDNYIYFLRRRLKSLKSILTIKAVRGVGYRLEDTNVQKSTTAPYLFLRTGNGADPADHDQSLPCRLGKQYEKPERNRVPQQCQQYSELHRHAADALPHLACPDGV